MTIVVPKPGYYIITDRRKTKAWNDPWLFYVNAYTAGGVLVARTRHRTLTAMQAECAGWRARGARERKA